jgi:hypothetical protein
MKIQSSIAATAAATSTPAVTLAAAPASAPSAVRSAAIATRSRSPVAPRSPGPPVAGMFGSRPPPPAASRRAASSRACGVGSASSTKRTWRHVDPLSAPVWS